jgi:hypothetical protein
LITPGVFQHVALTYDKTTGDAKLYRNGTVVAARNVGSPALQTSMDLFWGLAYRGGTPWRYRGLMDEITLYNRSLSADESARFTSQQCGQV